MCELRRKLNILLNNVAASLISSLPSYLKWDIELKLFAVVVAGLLNTRFYDMLVAQLNEETE